MDNLMEISVTEAKSKLSKLIKEVENGKAVTICRDGVPTVDLVLSKRSRREKPQFGTLRAGL
jgi:prevent-host-death family protein